MEGSGVKIEELVQQNFTGSPATFLHCGLAKDPHTEARMDIPWLQ